MERKGKESERKGYRDGKTRERTGTGVKGEEKSKEKGKDED